MLVTDHHLVVKLDCLLCIKLVVEYLQALDMTSARLSELLQSTNSTQGSWLDLRPSYCLSLRG